ncbi:MAG: heparinase II/III family protein [Rikenellaceae bacterium]
MKNLTKLFILLITLTIVTDVVAQKSFDYENIAPHPRLLMPAGGEEKIRELIAQDESMARVHNDIVAFCDRLLGMAPVRSRANLTASNNMLGISRTAQERIFNLAYCYRMTGDERYAARALKEMEAVCDFETWNPLHFLDVGEMAMALALGYDWLYDYLTPQSKAKIREAILIKAFKTAEDTNARFYRDINNWNSVCNCGFAYAGLALLDEAPQESIFVIEKCLQTNPLATECYGPDGGFPEGYNYWGYGATFQLLISAGFESAFGTDNGISQAQGFMESARFIQFMTAPSGDTFSFSDTPQEGQCHFAMFWFAKKSNDPSLVWLERKYMEAEKCKYAANRLMPALLIFAADLDCDLAKIAAPKENHWFNHGATPTYIYRGGWESTEDTYLGVKGGYAQTSHAHLDSGSFVFEKNGKRWSGDLGSQGYGILSHGVDLWGKGQNSDRWKIFRISSQAHSTITVNNRAPFVDQHAEIIKTYQTAKKKGAKVELTPLYSYALDKAQRTVWLDKKDNLTVEDEIENGESDSELMWVMCTPSQAKIISDTQIELKQGEEKMLLEVWSPTPMQLKVWSNEAPNDYEDKNEGSCRVGFTTTIAANQKATWRVTLRDSE